MRNNIRLFLSRYRDEESYRQFVQAGFSSLLIRVFGMACGFVVTLITSRFYGADALGIVSVCIAILSFAAVIGKLGMDTALMRYIAESFYIKDYGSVKSFYIGAWKFMFPAALLLTGVLFFSASYMAEQIFHKPHLESTLRLNSLFVLPLILLLINSECIRGLERIKTYTLLQTSAVSVLSILMLIAGLYIYSDRYLPVYIQFAAITVAGMLSYYLWLRHSHWFMTARREGVYSLRLFRTSSPMFVTTLMQLMMTWVGTLIMASYYSEAETGVYNAIVRISTFMNITVLAVNSMASPRIAAAFSSGRADEMKLLSKESVRLIAAASLPVFAVLFLFPHFVLSVFGKDFTGHEDSLMLLLAGQLFVSFAGLSSQILSMTGREQLMRNNAILAAIINIAGCFLLIPSYGIWGASIAQVAGMLAWNVLCILSVRSEFGFNPFFSFRVNKKV